MNLYSKNVQKYLEDNTKARAQTLIDLDRRTYVEKLMPQMISGHVQGNFLSMMTRIQNAQRVLELGTFTGYATICFASAVAENGMVHTIEQNPEYLDLAKQFWNEAGVKDKITQHIGDAVKLIPTIDEEWDLVFLDAAKRRYSEFYDLVFPKLKIGGLILADNVLWSGKVISDPSDAVSQKLIEFNTMINNDPRVENVILPLRDGINLIRKVSE